MPPSNRIALMLVPTAFGQQAPSQMLNQYRNERITWMTNVWPYANNLGSTKD
jgi:hypothetical protein